MDLKGSLADTNLRIYPSKKLQTFLEAQTVTDNVPNNIGKLIKGDDYKQKDKNVNLKPIEISLSNKDVKVLAKIKSLVKENDTKHKDENEENVDPNTVKEVDNKDDTDDAKSDTEEEVTLPEGPYLTTSDIEWLYEYLKERRKKDENIPYLFDLFEGSQIEMPPNQVIKRNPALEARCVKLRAQQEAREYRKMTKGVDNVRMKFPEDSISYQLKQMNRQLIAIGQFIISIFAGFLFGFRGVEWMVGNLDFGFRLLLGVMCALVIALAEIYFLAKKLNEELSVPETTQLGGPPKFTDEKYNQHLQKAVDKPHQD